MKILVTGCDGVIGTYLCNQLTTTARLTAKVIGIDNCRKYHRDIQRRNCEFYAVDTKNLVSVKDVMETNFPDVVIDLAADIGGIKYMNSGSDQMLNNIKGNINVIQSCIENDIKYIFASSGILDSDDDSYYSNYKRSVENILNHTKYDNYSIIRFNNIVGKYEDCEEKKQHIIPTLVKKIKKSDSIQLFGTGKEVRSFTHGLDCAKAIIECIANDNKKIYNIINKNNIICIDELAKLINSKIRNDSLNIEYIPNTYPDAVYQSFPESNISIKYDIDLDAIISEAVYYY